MISPSHNTLQGFYSSVYLPLRLRGKSASTKGQYLIQLRHFEKFLGRDPLLTDLTDEVVSAFLASIIERGNAPATANKARNHILALWRLAARKQFVAEYPDVAPETEPRRVPKAWMPDELQKLFEACEQLPGRVGAIPASVWWYALLVILWWTGERIGAVLQLKWSDLDQNSGWLTVPAEARKRKTGDMIFHLPPEAMTALAKITVPRRPLIFPWPFGRNYVWNRYNKILKEAGLPSDRKSKFHRIRKSTASYYEAAGGNATDLLGHSERSVTMAYLDPRIAKGPQPAAKLFSPHSQKNDDPQLRLF